MALDPVLLTPDVPLFEPIEEQLFTQRPDIAKAIQYLPTMLGKIPQALVWLDQFPEYHGTWEHSLPSYNSNPKTLPRESITLYDKDGRGNRVAHPGYWLVWFDDSLHVMSPERFREQFMPQVEFENLVHAMQTVNPPEVGEQED